MTDSKVRTLSKSVPVNLWKRKSITARKKRRLLLGTRKMSFIITQ